MPVLLLFFAAVLAAVDQFLKMLVVTNIKPIGSLEVIPGVLRFVYLENTGISFGLFQGVPWLFQILSTVLAIAVIVFVLVYKHPNRVFLRTVRTAGVLVIAGAVGNVIDRFAFGHVVDYISFSFFPFVFNFADCCVVIGGLVGAAALLYLYRAEKKGKDAAGSSEPPEESEHGSD